MLSDDTKDQEFLASYLYYFGVLTLEGLTDTLQLVLTVPNLVIKGLYLDRIKTMLLRRYAVVSLGYERIWWEETAQYSV